MRKYLILATVPLLVFCGWLIAQVTITNSLDMAILYRASSDVRGLKYISPYVAWKNNQGNVLEAVRADTTAMITAYSSYQKAWIWTVKDTVTVNSSFGKITFRRINWGAGGFSDTTLTVYKAIWTEFSDLIPYVDVNLAPFDSAFVGAQFTIAYLASQFE